MDGQTDRHRQIKIQIDKQTQNDRKTDRQMIYKRTNEKWKDRESV